MHNKCGLNPVCPVFKVALHVYAETEATGVHREALFAVERDVEHEPDLGPACRGAPTHEYHLRNEVFRNKSKFA